MVGHRDIVVSWHLALSVVDLDLGEKDAFSQLIEEDKSSPYRGEQIVGQTTRGPPHEAHRRWIYAGVQVNEMAWWWSEQSRPAYDWYNAKKL